MHSIEALLGMIRTEAVENGGMSEEQVRRYGPPEQPREDPNKERLSFPFNLRLVRYIDEGGVERYKWVD